MTERKPIAPAMQACGVDGCGITHGCPWHGTRFEDGTQVDIPPGESRVVGHLTITNHSVGTLSASSRGEEMWATVSEGEGSVFVQQSTMTSPIGRCDRCGESLWAWAVHLCRSA